MNDSLEETQQAIFSVAEFNIVLNQHLSLLKDVNITGEITQMTITAKKGVYITLKDPDQNALLSVSGYAPTIQGINLVEEGMKVTISGTPELYSPMGKFSVKIFKIVPVGEGALKDAYEKLKQKLDKEGLFNPERKRELPDFITKIALITANKSAAQSDFLKILKENKANLEIDFYPVQVQGKYSEQEIISTLKFLSNKSEYDCVVLTRGGGSLEDLITFNEEQVARTIYAMNIPVVVGVGHEEEPTIKTFIYYLETPGKKGDTELLKYTGTQGMFVKDVLNTHKLTIDKIYLLESSYIDLKETSITYNTSVKLKN